MAQPLCSALLVQNNPEAGLSTEKKKRKKNDCAKVFCKPGECNARETDTADSLTSIQLIPNYWISHLRSQVMVAS